MKKEFISVGTIVNAHGIRGEVKLNPVGFDPEFLAEFDRFIIGGKESVILAPPAGLKRGIVALAWVENRRYVLHRIERIEGESVTLMGDGNLVGREHCSIGDVKAIATHVVDRNQKRHYLYTRWRKTASEIWWALLPLRRYILKLNI